MLLTLIIPLSRTMPETMTPGGQSGRLYLSINDDVPPQWGLGFQDNEGTIDLLIRSQL